MNGSHPSEERLNDYLLYELDGAEMETISTHLEGCAECRDTAERLDGALDAYRSAAAVCIDETALDRLRDELQACEPPPRREITMAVAAAAAVVIFVAGFWVGHNDAMQSVDGRVELLPAASPEVIRDLPDRDPPAVTFAAADADLLGGLAPRDTTWN